MYQSEITYCFLIVSLAALPFHLLSILSSIIFFAISKMPEPISYAIAENLLKKLGSPVFNEIGLMCFVKYELEKLEDTLSSVKARLLDVEEQQVSSDGIEVWVRRLNDVVYDADDLLDDFATEDLRRKTDDRGICGQVTDFFSSSNRLVFLCKMGHRVKAIRERLDDIGKDTLNLNLNSTSGVRGRNRSTETCSAVPKSPTIVGRGENRREIIELLIQPRTQGNLSFVVIVGIGGLGKTTLAQLVYNDQEVVNYFDRKMWVCVSDVFDVKELVKNILRSASNGDVGDLPLEQLRKRLQEKLDGKKYLLVLDDVWNGDKEKWDHFTSLLPVGANGSKILITTRSEIVARVIGIDHPYVVKGLKDDESWDLFKSLAFKEPAKPSNNLVAIGKEIVGKCKGVPLVIKTLGSTLRWETETEWLKMKENENLIMFGDNKNDTILRVLRLSYDNLPIHLKQCFVYCALFPKDYIIEKRSLVQLWVAQGYITPPHENERLEYVGDKYFNDLLTRSLFEEVEKDDVNHDVLRCKMHDLIHDLAQSIVKSEVIILTNDNMTIPDRIHHVSLFKKPNEMPKDLKGKPMRTFFMDSYCDDMDSYCDDHRFISSLKRSRVLKMVLSYEALSSIAELSHLRYLDLSHGSFENLPDGITRLNYLQTLKLFRCTNLKEWPRKMKDLINLRHLEIDSLNKLTYMPRGLGELTNLQTLPLFRVDNDSGECRHDRIDGLGELNSLNNLRGQLNIHGLSHVTGRKATEANLKDKQYLERLRIYWKGPFMYRQEIQEAVSVMESLQPHSNLKELLIHTYEGERFPNWMMNDRLDLLLPNLVTIKIIHSYSSKVLPPFSQLPSLKYLLLSHHKYLECMKDYPSPANQFFQSLKKLELYVLPKLKGWGREDVAAAPPYPCLEDLHLRNITTELCLHLISASPSLKYLKIEGIKDVISLPELQRASTLQTLTITDLPRLETLPNWIGCLTSLTQLRIRQCPELTSLPQERRFLCHLRTLRIYDCPRLSEECKDQTGEYWPEISRIPQIWID